MHAESTRPAASADSTIDAVRMEDLDGLLQLEEASFAVDRISRRRFRHWISAANRVFLVARDSAGVAGYGLVLLHRGTRLARLYSLAVAERARGSGLGTQLLHALEQGALEAGRLYMRLEVDKRNAAAIRLYEKLGYHAFGEYQAYYADKGDALRMQKIIRRRGLQHPQTAVPWYGQTTEFSCGPASLMMAMASLDPTLVLDRELELDIWREATTIFMTSGHGGCHPFGLALAARRRGFAASVLVNSDKPLFVEGVRAEHKKQVITAVDEQFRRRAVQQGVDVIQGELSLARIETWLAEGWAVVVLVSTYRIDGRKVPHWVTVTALDDACLYVHDPAQDDKLRDPLDCQHVPVAREDFVKMASYGAERLRTAVAIHR
jgi:ribosomal protein S18 acetylase RimI-like enzyme